MTSRTVQICRAEDNTLVDATFFDGLRSIDLTLIERQWAPWRQRIVRSLLENAVDRRSWPESLHWNWSRKAEELTLFATEGKAIDYENEWQGAMLFDTSSHAGKLAGQEKKPIVYVEYVELLLGTGELKKLVRSVDFEALGSYY